VTLGRYALGMSRRGVRQYHLIASHLRALIEDGELPSGAKLPTEEDLRQRYGVSRTMVRNALRQLRRSGFVEARQGQGHFVVDRKPTIIELIPAGHQWRCRMPRPDEVERLGLLTDGEPVIEICHAGIPIEVRSTLHKTFDWSPGEDSSTQEPARPS
jgi:biotin operon repressor